MIDINEINILDIQPSQFFLSEEKIRQISEWFVPDDLSNFEPVTIKLINGDIIFTDGHTRAFVAYIKGLTKIPLLWDEDELDWEAYRICVNASKKRNIHCIADLKKRILSDTEYKKQWDNWCDTLHEILELQRL